MIACVGLLIQRGKRVLKRIIIFRCCNEGHTIDRDIPDINIIRFFVNGIIADRLTVGPLFLDSEKAALIQINRIDNTGTFVGDRIPQFPRGSIRVIPVYFKVKYFTLGRILVVHALAERCVGGSRFLQLSGTQMPFAPSRCLIQLAAADQPALGGSDDCRFRPGIRYKEHTHRPVQINVRRVRQVVYNMLSNMLYRCRAPINRKPVGLLGNGNMAGSLVVENDDLIGARCYLQFPVSFGNRVSQSVAV